MICVSVDQVVSNQDVGHDSVEVGDSLKEMVLFC